MMALRIGLLALAIWFTFVNTVHAARGRPISAANLVVMALSWAGFVAAMGWLS